MPTSSAFFHLHIITYRIKLTFSFLIYSFVPAQIPRKRRLQMLAVAVWSVMIVITTCAWLLLWYACLFTHFPGPRASFSTLLLFLYLYLCKICRFLLWILGWRHHLFSSIPPLWPLLVLYLIWSRWIDDAPEKGGRSSQWFRSSRFWKYFADYYPAS